ARLDRRAGGGDGRREQAEYPRRGRPFLLPTGRKRSHKATSWIEAWDRRGGRRIRRPRQTTACWYRIPGGAEGIPLGWRGEERDRGTDKQKPRSGGRGRR